jgi:hypothetical protein
MARKSKKTSYSFPNVGEVWVCRNGQQRKVVAIHNGFLIEWEEEKRPLTGKMETSGKCDLRSWYEGSNQALHITQ